MLTYSSSFTVDSLDLGFVFCDILDLTFICVFLLAYMFFFMYCLVSLCLVLQY